MSRDRRLRADEESSASPTADEVPHVSVYEARVSGPLSRGERALLALGLVDEESEREGADDPDGLDGPHPRDEIEELDDRDAGDTASGAGGWARVERGRQTLGAESGSDGFSHAFARHEEVWFEATQLASASHVELGTELVPYVRGLGAFSVGELRERDSEPTSARVAAAREDRVARVPTLRVDLSLRHDDSTSSTIDLGDPGNLGVPRYSAEPGALAAREALASDDADPFPSGASAADASPLGPRAARALLGAPAGSIIEWSCESRPLALALASQLAFRWAGVAQPDGAGESAVLACWPGALAQLRTLVSARVSGIDLRLVDECSHSPEIEAELRGVHQRLARRLLSMEAGEDVRGERFLDAVREALAIPSSGRSARLLLLVGQGPYLGLAERQDSRARQAWWQGLRGTASRAGAVIFYVHSQDPPAAEVLMRWRLARDTSAPVRGDASVMQLALEHDDLMGDHLVQRLRWSPPLALLVPLEARSSQEPSQR